MSVRAMSIVWDEAPIGGTALLVLLAIADHADDQGQAYPSINGLARKCRISESTARRHVQELEQAGLLVVRPGGGRWNNTYMIRFDRLRRLGPLLHVVEAVDNQADEPGDNTG